MRRAFSLVELLTALVLMALVLALVVRAAVFHERFQRADAAARGAARAAHQAVAIVAAALRPAGAGDLVPAGITDTSVDFLALVGSGGGCLAGPVLTYAAASTPEAAIASFAAAPRAGDSILVFDDSRAPPRWRATRVQGVNAGGLPCPLLAPGELRSLRLDAWLDAGPVVAFRVLRRTRFSLYRSGDGAWYLGMRDWNLAGGGFSGIQPVAGPLAPVARDPRTAGLHFTFVDGADRVLRVSARARGGADSAARDVGLARAPVPRP